MSNVYGNNEVEKFTSSVDIDSSGFNVSAIDAQINMNNQKIINMAAGSAGTDAVTFNQLNAAVSAAARI